MLASTDVPPVKQDGLVYEPKYDGIRALVELDPTDDGRVRIYSRNGNDKTAQFPAIAAALAKIVAKLDAPLLLDGEIVATSHTGAALGFQHIQHRISLTGETDIARAERDQPAALYVFDLLRDGDEDLRGQPLAARRIALQERLGSYAGSYGGSYVGRSFSSGKTSSTKHLVRLSTIATDDGTAMLEQAKTEGWEGLIVKDGQSLYHSGRRTPAWRKLKLLQQQEFVIGGWTEPRQTRSHFGSVLIGDRKGKDLVFAGSVGTGFTQTELDRLAALFAKRTMTASPFANRVVSNEKPHWITPDLICEVKFIERTEDGLLRQPVYLGLRDEKPTSAMPATRRVSLPTPDASLPLLSTLEDLERTKRDGEVVLPNGDKLRVTNLAKILWPKGGFTKGELIRYYVHVASMMLPAVEDRPLVMKRSPNGVEKPYFYQQRHPEQPPKGVRRETLDDDIDPIEEDGNGGQPRLIGGSLTTLLYMAQLAAISQDPWFSRVQDPLHMEYAAIDLDPGDDARFSDVVDVARWVHDELERLHIPSVPKTSGSSGLHIYIPLPKQTSYETGQLLCHVVATLVCAKHPKVATIERMVRKRARAAIYVDYLQNIIGKTLATAYSARASDYAGVSTPLKWEEVDRQLDPRDFTIRTAPERFAEVGDLWKPLRTLKPVNISTVLKKLK